MTAFIFLISILFYILSLNFFPECPHIYDVALQASEYLNREHKSRVARGANKKLPKLSAVRKVLEGRARQRDVVAKEYQ